MIILHTIQDMNPLSGGPATCTFALLNHLNKLNLDIDLITLNTPKNNPKPIGINKKWMKALTNDAILPIGYSKNVEKELKASHYDLYHANGLWEFVIHQTCSTARKKKKPYIISPHGSLYPNALKKSFWKKWPLLKLYINKDITKAYCIHATCRQEMTFIRQYGYKGPIAVIANPINTIPAADELFELKKNNLLNKNNKITFGFLGRIHPIKKIENILYGASLLDKKTKFKIVIIGKGDDAYEDFLRKEADRLHLKDKVSFKGFIDGQEKYEELANMSALFVPSESENFGMIVPEALSVGTPVMASLGTPWEDLNKYNCGWWQDCSPENIANILNYIKEMNHNELISMGVRGRKLVKENYSGEQIARDMTFLYSWILEGGEKPDFVYL